MGLQIKSKPSHKSIFYITSQSDSILKQDGPHFVLLPAADAAFAAENC